MLTTFVENIKKKLLKVSKYEWVRPQYNQIVLLTLTIFLSVGRYWAMSDNRAGVMGCEDMCGTHDIPNRGLTYL